ncbi:GNAT family N-acetyltransferase [Xanthovirga aplysinae]|uniref:GNAT family N-acetyltransferase n=1 Tax=Xanthovirga aplysinae TaxID=2529853 RepID=UPI0012BCDB94|nr:GNAT family N-acetyltransferase [Xanthovirga aplysinae]MTI33268.1 GNAT family N-acetyltransferase [Xanthovirga aplysinae]
MQTSINNYKPEIKALALDLATNSYLNSYLREIDGGERYFQKPKYDPVVAELFERRNHERWIKIPLKKHKKDIFCALTYFSQTGRHSFALPVVVRDQASDQIRALNFEELVTLTLKEYELSNQKNDGEEIEVNVVKDRLNNHVQNLFLFLEWHASHPEKLNRINGKVQNFIEAEQSLILGHAMHPLGKSRQGFSKEELLQYSPETGGRFALNYYLADPSIVWQDTTLDKPIDQQLKEELLADNSVPSDIKDKIKNKEEWSLLPLHPWEATYLNQQPDVKELLKNKLLVDLGVCGKKFTATSSIRTVYHEDSDFMIKLSLDVKITNSKRVNIPKELYRSAEMGRLFESSFGEQIRKNYPTFEAITDPAYIGIKHKGQVINGFNTSFRNNPFKTDQNISLLAAICQDGILGSPSRLQIIINSICEKDNCSQTEASEEWFKRYLAIGFRNLVHIYNEFGLAFEAHQQNTLIRLDEKGYPDRFFFRDNQGFFFLDSRISEVQKIIPELGELSESYGPAEFINSKLTYYLVINNILGVINAMGRAKLSSEKRLLELFHEEASSLHQQDKTGFLAYILQERAWEVKGNLLTSLYEMDEVIRPIDNQSVYVDYLNPLHLVHYQKDLLKPETIDILFERYFEKSDLTVSVRPFDFEKGDLELLHKWFHMDYAKPFWAMNMSLQELEAFYLNLSASDYAHPFIGIINGEILFTVESYWSIFDELGKHYDAKPSDYGAHFMIGPRTSSQKQYSLYALRTVAEFFFSHPKVERITGEPNAEAKPMIQLAKLIGFQSINKIKLPNKEASLLFLTPENLEDKFPEKDGFIKRLNEELYEAQG